MLNRLVFPYARRLPAPLRRVAQRVFYGWLDARHRAAYGTADLFETVQIETSSVCNRRCAYCPNAVPGVRRPERWLPTPLVHRILNELEEMAYRGVVVFSGYNEPLLDPRLGDLLHRTRATLPRCRIVVYTNGDHLDAAWIAACARLRVDCNVTRHGGPAAEARLERVLAAIPWWRRRHVTLKRDITGTALSTRGGLVSVPKVQARPSCHVPATELTLMSDGNVVLCSDDYASTVVFGHVAHKSLREIWADPRYRRIRHELRQGRATLPLCRHCR